MYAIVKTGGKQYTVEAGDVFDVEKLVGEPGDKVQLPVLFLNDGTNVITSADELANIKVEAEIVDHHKGEKKLVFKFKKRKGYKRKKGHRQNLTRICITNLNGVEAQVPQPKAPKAEAPAEAQAAEEVAAEPAEAPEDLNAMTVAQLKDIAKERDIKLPSGARKAEIIEAIENAQ